MEESRIVKIYWSLRTEVSYKLIMHIGADSPCLFSLKCFEPHVVKFHLDGMEPWSQVAAQKKVQESLLGSRKLWEKSSLGKGDVIVK